MHSGGPGSVSAYVSERRVPWLGPRLEVAQLQRARLTAEARRGIGELLAGDELALRVNDFRALLTLGFGLASHGALHGLWQLEVAHLDAGDFHAPGACLGVDDLLQLGIDLVAFGQQVIEVRLAQDAAQRR